MKITVSLFPKGQNTLLPLSNGEVDQHEPACGVEVLMNPGRVSSRVREAGLVVW